MIHLKKRIQSAIIALSCVFALLSLGVGIVSGLGSQSNNLEVSFLDVGQGDAIFISAPGGTQVLIDGGRSSQVLRSLREVMPFWDRSIDIVVATHPDADHIGGLIDVFERFDVSYVLDTPLERGNTTFVEYTKARDREGAERIEAARGTVLKLDENVILTVLSQEVVAASDSNEASIILRLDYGDTSFLFTGDATKHNELELLQFYEALDVDVLKVGHHGSDTSTSTEFLSAASPQYGVISLGKNNSYGHPHGEVVERLEDAGVTILRTDELGTIRFVSDGTLLKRKPITFFERLFGI